MRPEFLRSQFLRVVFRGTLKLAMVKTRYPPKAGAPKRPPRPPKRRQGRLHAQIQNPPRARPQRYMRLFLEQEGLCFYCRTPMQLPNPMNLRAPLPPDRVTIEHLFAGSDDPRLRKYVVAACHACNQERGSNFHWREFMLAKIMQYWAPH